MSRLDRFKKAVLDACFRPVELEAPALSPTTVLSLGDVPALFDPTRNGPPQQGVPRIRLYDDVTVWPAQSVAHCGPALAFDTFMDAGHTAHLGALNALRHYPIRRRRGWATAIESVYPTANYYHFFVDTLPRAWALHHPALRGIPITLYLTRPLAGPKKAVLRSVLPPNVTICTTHRFTRLATDRYVHLPYLSTDRAGHVPERGETSGGFLPQEYLEFFRRHMLARADAAAVPSPERIFVSRKGASMRRLTNERAVAAFLEARGFVTVRPETYSLAEQAHLFSTAETVVAQHGAALTNLLYMRQGAVVEVFSSHHTPQYYTQCARTLGLQYEAITLDRGWKNADAHLPLDALARALSALEGGASQERGGSEGGSEGGSKDSAPPRFLESQSARP